MSGGGTQRRCTYAGCVKPEKSKKYYSIDEATRAGGRDWKPLHGHTLCTNCYKRYTHRGTLERYEPLSAHEKKCSYEGCSRPDTSSNFYLIHKGNKAGGQDWSALESSVLCDACYSRFKKRGTLSKTDSQELGTAAQPVAQRRCSNAACDKPDKSVRYYTVEEGRTSGGRDWGALTGKCLCHSCYQRFKIYGTLDKKQAEAAGGGAQAAPGGIAIGGPPARKCSYSQCQRPTQSTQFHTVEVGGHDWSALEKNVLCDVCYNRFKKTGTLQRLPEMNLAPDTDAKRCSYAKCRKPDGSSHYYAIEEGKASGGQTWTSLVGQTLCEACHRRFRTTGSLEGGLCAPKLEKDQRVCSYSGCMRPKQSSRFLMIEPETKAGGQDWRALEGSVLCIACYQFYKKKGTLERPAKPTLEVKLGGPPPEAAKAAAGAPAKIASISKAIASVPAKATATVVAAATAAVKAQPVAAAVATAAPVAAATAAAAAPAAAVGKPTQSSSTPASAGRPTLSKSSVPVPPKQKEKENQKEKEREREREEKERKEKEEAAAAAAAAKNVGVKRSAPAEAGGATKKPKAD